MFGRICAPAARLFSSGRSRVFAIISVCWCDSKRVAGVRARRPEAACGRRARVYALRACGEPSSARARAAHAGSVSSPSVVW